MSTLIRSATDLRWLRRHAMPDPRPTMFPARVTLPDGSVHFPVRVESSSTGVTRAWVWDWAANGPQVIGTWSSDELVRADGVTRGAPTRYTVADGSVLDAVKHCGCGHPLKTWRPAREAFS